MRAHGRVSASMVGVLPSDPFVHEEALLVTHGDLALVGTMRARLAASLF